MYSPNAKVRRPTTHTRSLALRSSFGGYLQQKGLPLQPPYALSLVDTKHPRNESYINSPVRRPTNHARSPGLRSSFWRRIPQKTELPLQPAYALSLVQSIPATSLTCGFNAESQRQDAPPITPDLLTPDRVFCGVSLRKQGCLSCLPMLSPRYQASLPD